MVQVPEHLGPSHPKSSVDSLDGVDTDRSLAYIMEKLFKNMPMIGDLIILETPAKLTEINLLLSRLRK